MTKIKYSMFTILIFLLFTTPVFASWMINEDYKQPDNRGATDFEILFKGNVAGQITSGGFSSVTNPFANPTRTTSTDAFGNTIVRFSGSNSIPRSTTEDLHFGIFGNGKKPQVLVKAWSFPSVPTRVPVPKSNFDFRYDPDTQVLNITIENTSPDTVTFQDVGYLLSEDEYPIEELNRQGLPPEVFEPLAQLNHEYAPGDSDNVQIPNVNPSAFAITYGTVFFSGASSGNDYNGTGGEWAQVSVIDQVSKPIPTISEWGFIIMTLLLLMAGSIALTKRRFATRLVVVIVLFLTLGSTTIIRADVFVLPLIAPAYDEVPTIEFDGQKLIIDTGGGAMGTRLTPAAATALGVDLSTGTPQTYIGTGGQVQGSKGATMPDGIGPTGASTPVTPEGQAVTTPPLPATADVAPLPPSIDGYLGSEWLNMFNYGRAGNFFWLSKKDQGTEGMATAIAMASFLGLSSPVTPDQSGRPKGTRSKPITPTPDREPPEDEGVEDAGYDMGVGLRIMEGVAIEDVPFIIKTGLPQTFISESTALSLGLDLNSLPIEQSQGNFGPINVRQAQLTLDLFNDPDFRTFTVPVGILSPADNPYGTNVLGGDILGQLPYWEISEDQQGVIRFYAAAEIRNIPIATEWGLIVMAVLLVAAGAIVIWRRQRRAA